MKAVYLLVCAMFLSVATFATHPTGDWSKQLNGAPEMSALTPEMTKMGLEQFMALTPKKYQEMTGEKLGLKKTLQLKAAQKMVKKQLRSNEPVDLDKGIYVLLAILGLGFLGIGLISDWNGSEWIVCLILSVLCWLPGLIYALVKMKNYY